MRHTGKRLLCIAVCSMLVSGCNNNTDTVQNLNIYRLELPERQLNMEEVREAFASQDLPLYFIDKCNWPQSYPYSPLVHFNIAYDDSGLYLRFFVSEQAIRATFQEDSSARSWEDSCVELFLSPKGRQSYYNFEFTCIGVCHAAYGPGRGKREVLDTKTRAGILRLSSLGRQAFGLREESTSWLLYIAIPWTVMDMEAAPQAGEIWRGNLYKCGDKMPTPHFLSWSPIGTEKPDFHQPRYFGTLTFK